MLPQVEVWIGSTCIVPTGSRATTRIRVLLVEELTHAGVEGIFLNRPLGQSPEDQVLLQVQGVIAE
jgi:hypothetical protein